MPVSVLCSCRQRLSWQHDRCITLVCKDGIAVRDFDYKSMGFSYCNWTVRYVLYLIMIDNVILDPEKLWWQENHITILVTCTAEFCK